MKLVMP